MSTGLVRPASLGGRSRLRAAAARRLAFCRSALQGGANYARNLAWLVARSLEGRALRAVGAVTCGQLSLAAQAGALALLYWYAEQAQADAVVSLGPFGLEWRAREDFRLLGGVVAASGLCYLANAGLLHWAQNLIIGIGEEELARRLTEVVRIARRLPDPRAADASRIFLESGISQVGRGCRFAAASTVAILGAVTPVIGGVVAGVALLVIDPVLTGMLVLAAGLWCLLLYPLMMRQVAVADRLVQGKRAFANESQALLRSSPGNGLPEVLNSAVELSRVVVGRRRVTNAIATVLETGKAVCATVAALYLAASIIDGNDDWPKFILYLGGLRVALNGGFAAPSVFGTVSRFYPRLLVWIRFRRSAAGIDDEPLGRVGAGDAVVLGRLPDGGPVDAGGGARIALAALAAPPMVRAAFLQARAVESGRPLGTAWVRTDDPSVPIREDASIHLVDAAAFTEMEPAAARAFLDRVPTGVTVIVHRDETGVGAFGESHLLVVEDGAFSEHVRLGTDESRAVLESFAAARVHAAATDPGRAASAFDTVGAGEQDDEET